MRSRNIGGSCTRLRSRPTSYIRCRLVPGRGVSSGRGGRWPFHWETFLPECCDCFLFERKLPCQFWCQNDTLYRSWIRFALRKECTNFVHISLNAVFLPISSFDSYIFMRSCGAPNAANHRNGCRGGTAYLGGRKLTVRMSSPVKICLVH